MVIKLPFTDKFLGELADFYRKNLDVWHGGVDVHPLVGYSICGIEKTETPNVVRFLYNSGHSELFDTVRKQCVSSNTTTPTL